MQYDTMWSTTQYAAYRCVACTPWNKQHKTQLDGIVYHFDDTNMHIACEGLLR
eukprot:m.1084973 g.1084973  ORF g.1084973 m.1084973 type:complete len:53 (+) comp24277_c0_seq1:2339-2497(+)